jgi:hypothetical protein
MYRYEKIVKGRVTCTGKFTKMYTQQREIASTGTCTNYTTKRNIAHARFKSTPRSKQRTTPAPLLRGKPLHLCGVVPDVVVVFFDEELHCALALIPILVVGPEVLNLCLALCEETRNYLVVSDLVLPCLSIFVVSLWCIVLNTN